MDVGDALARGVGDDAVDQPDRRRVVGRVEQIVGARQGGGEMAEFVAEAERAGRVGGRLGAGGIEIREQAVEGRPVHLVHGERPREEAAQLDQRLRVGAFAHRDVGLPVASPVGDQAVAAGEGIRNVANRRAGRVDRFPRAGSGRGRILAAPDPHCGGTWLGGASAGVTTASVGCGSAGAGRRHRADIVADQLVERRLAVRVGRAAAGRGHNRSGARSSPAHPRRVRRMVGRMNTIRLVRAARAPARAEQIADDRHVAEQRHLVDRAPLIVVEQAADADDLAVVDGDRRLDLALVEDQVRRSSRETGPAIELTSWRRSSLIVPPALICGRTSSVMPTFWRWTVRKVLSKLCGQAPRRW